MCVPVCVCACESVRAWVCLSVCLPARACVCVWGGGGGGECARAHAHVHSCVYVRFTEASSRPHALPIHPGLLSSMRLLCEHTTVSLCHSGDRVTDPVEDSSSYGVHYGCLTDFTYRLVGLVVRRPPRERKVRGSNPASDGIFSGSSHTSDLKIGTPVATLPGAWHYRVSTGTGNWLR